MNTLFAALGLNGSESISQIKKAFRAFALKFHPDNKKSGDAEFFKEVSGLYDTFLRGRKEKHTADTTAEEEELKKKEAEKKAKAEEEKRKEEEKKRDEEAKKKADDDKKKADEQKKRDEEAKKKADDDKKKADEQKKRDEEILTASMLQLGYVEKKRIARLACEMFPNLSRQQTLLSGVEPLTTKEELRQVLKKLGYPEGTI